MSDADVVRRYFEAFSPPRDHDALASHRHPTFEVVWAQSGERIPSHAADVQVHSSYPGYPDHELGAVAGHEAVWLAAGAQTGITLVRPMQVSGGGDLWIGEGRLTYPDGSVWYAVVVLELIGGLVSRETTWFAPLRAAGRWLVAHGEEFEWAPADLVETSGSPSTARAYEYAMDDYFATRRDRPEGAVEGFFHEDAVVSLPQYGYRIRGRDRIARAAAEDPSRSPLRVSRLRVVGTVGLAEVRLEDGDDRWWVCLFTFDGDRAIASTAYRLPDLPAPEWRSMWVEPLPPSIP